ncbi:MAG: hypothetical protein JWQ02_3704 [Capsulimonas sp.]|nr:hypothetical protein [Capsulimonas sp.]
MMQRPDNIRALDAKAGLQWSEQEVARAWRWWLERDQERLVWFAATRYLGWGVQSQDIEEAWVAFYADVVEKSRRSYRPGGPDFATYALHVCFKRDCIRRGEEIRVRSQTFVSLSSDPREKGGFEPVSHDASPHTIAERAWLVREVLCFIQNSPMPHRHKRAFILKHFDEKSNEEIASELGAEVGAVKVWAYRAAVKVQEYLCVKEWMS